MQPDNTVKRVLIYRLGSLGDTAVAMPCFHLAARAFPRARRILLSNIPVHAKAPAAAAVLEGSGLVHGYMHYEIGMRKASEVLRLAWRIRRFSPEVLIYLTAPRGARPVKRDALFFRFCGIRRIVGLPAGELAENRYDPATGLWEQEAARLLRCVRSLGDADIDDLRNWDLNLTDGERAMAARSLAPLGEGTVIACGPGTKMQAKDWGEEKWRELLGLLHARYPKAGLVLAGAREDFDIAERAAMHWNGPKVNLCGRLSPRETAAVLQQAAVFLGPDSGPMHLAACVGIPCAIAFSARGRPGMWFPAGRQHRIAYHRTSCYGCGLETCVEEGRRCLTSITVDEMAEAVAGILDRQTEDGRTDTALTTSPGS